jgi:GntR family transcriptional repressor for pyruvate dehydrogenase complex
MEPAGVQPAGASVVLLTPIAVPKAAESSLSELRELILSCELDDGAFMPSERVLVEQPQTSRATVREALRILDEIQI